jgi:hypothetical protein
MMPNTFRPEPRCHVCRNKPIRVQVNTMLGEGSSYAQIVRAVAADGNQVSLDSVRNHANLHFPSQNVAKAMYREIVERRAAQCEIDFVNGVATAITPIAFLETMMVKGFQNLVRDDTEVNPEMGLKAAEKLHKIIGSDDSSAKMLQLWAEMGRVIDMVKATVPPSLWPEISAGLKELGSGRIDLSESDTIGPQEPCDPDQVVMVPIDPGDDGDDF